MNESVLDFIKEQKWKWRASGDELEIPCPFPSCPNSGQKQFYINKNTGVWFCHRCGKKGKNVKELGFQLGLITLQDPIKTTHIFIPQNKVQEMHEQLLTNAPAMDYLTRLRGFKKSSILQFKLGYKSLPDGEAIVYPYFDETEACVGIKYKFFKGGNSKARFEKGSKIQLYNLHRVNLKEPLIITEGEDDAITAWQFGYENVGSVPTGANGATEWVEQLSEGVGFTLCFDRDQAGQEGSRKLGERLGLSRCKQAYPRLKDLNEYLQCGATKEEVEAVFNTAEPMFKAPVTDISAYLEDAKEVLLDPEKFRGISTGWENIDEILGGIRMGEVTSASGITGHGKTTFSMALVGNIVGQDIKSLIISPEMREQYLLLELANNYFRRKITKVEELEEFIDATKDKIHIAKVFDTWTERKDQSILDRVFDIVDFSVKNRGVQFVLLDHLRLFLNPKSQESERFAIDEFMQRCVHCVIKNKIHIWLVVQPKGLGSDQRKVTIHDLKGSSNIIQDSHNVVLIHRNDDEKKGNLVEVEVGKNREFGTCGTAVLEFDLKSKSNYLEI